MRHKQIPTKSEDWIVVRGTHEPLISRDLFDRAQTARQAATHTLPGKYQPWFERNLYFSIYLMSFFDFLAFGAIDRRIYTGESAAEHALRGWDGGEGATGPLDVIGLIDQAYGVKRGTVEDRSSRPGGRTFCTATAL